MEICTTFAVLFGTREIQREIPKTGNLNKCPHSDTAMVGKDGVRAERTGARLFIADSRHRRMNELIRRRPSASARRANRSLSESSPIVKTVAAELFPPQTVLSASQSELLLVC
ncbi:hypothetical protein J6590_080323 [Homalodisca vitripennis]|nr:hypothetical protein J6590_080323 [Homalodisca vitripennis]